jgi:hypothetical protein
VVTSWLLALIFTKNKKRASILSLVFIVLFFVFGRLHDKLGNFVIKLPLINLDATRLLFILCLLVIIVSWFLIKKIPSKNLTKFNSNLLLVSFVLVISTLFSVIPAVVSGQKSVNYKSTQKDNEQTENKVQNTENLPDVYYIVLDGYARQDYLKNNFNYDNSEFIDGLKNRGFYVADRARSNYAHTHFSIPSTFNMKYLNYLSNEMGEESTDRAPLKQLMQYNEVVPIFRNMGYKYINIGSQWDWVRSSPYTDIEIQEDNPESRVLNIKLDEFALVYLQTTALKPWISSSIMNKFLARITGALDKLEKVPNIKEQPKFTFAHILSPHPPYLFDRNGVIDGQTELQLLNQGFSEKEKYVDQTIYINNVILKTIDKIISESSKPPLIILASDHGPASNLNESEFKETDTSKLDINGISERLGILNAYYFPNKDYSKLYPEITPVNSFRVILNQYFARDDIKLLEDKSYFSSNKFSEYRMTDVTDLIAP